MLILEELWNGNIAPAEGQYHPKREYKEAWGLVDAIEDQLKEQLSPENWKLFNNYLDAEGKARCLSEADIFIEGFRMGAKVLIDVFMNNTR